jgi:hypothetical protein
MKTTPNSVAPGDIGQLLNQGRPGEVVPIQMNR